MPLDNDHAAAAQLVADAWKRRELKLLEFYVIERGMNRSDAQARAMAEIQKMQQGAAI